jgi:thioredoxin-related protein
MRPITTLLLLSLAATLLAVPAVAQDDDQPDNRWVYWQSYREAVERSQAEGIPLLLHFTARWCKWCDKMKRETYADRHVIRYLNANFAMAMVDTEKLPALARKYDVEGLPTLWFLDGGGQRLTHIPGYVSAETLLPLLEFISTGAYESSGYDKWLERRK